MDNSRIMSKEKIERMKEKKREEKKWKEPKLEDVTGKIMAQPYIRFT